MNLKRNQEIFINLIKTKGKMKINEQFLSDMWDNIKPSSCKEDTECDRKRENVIEKYINSGKYIDIGISKHTPTHTPLPHTFSLFFFFFPH